MADIHLKERNFQVLRFCLDSRDFRVVTEGNFLRVMMPQYSSGPGTGPKSLGRRKYAPKVSILFKRCNQRRETQVGQEEPDLRAEKLPKQEKKRVADNLREKKSLDWRQKVQGRPQDGRVKFFTSGNSSRRLLTVGKGT